MKKGHIEMEGVIAGIIREALGGSAGKKGEGIVVEVSVPEKDNFGHYSTNVAMRMGGAGVKAGAGSNPIQRAQDLSKKIRAAAPAGFFDKVEAVPPGFINFWLRKEAVVNHFLMVARDRKFGRSNAGRGAKIIIEYSSPNIAKTLNVGHLRNTVLGAALANIHEALGYDVVRWNYIGDWGTQFGKLVAAYKMWGKRDVVMKEPLEELQKLYVRFHEEEKSSPELAERGREEFKKLESGDKENKKLWGWFRSESIEELKRAYKLLGAEFDVWIGESFFNKEVGGLVRALLKEGTAEKSEGAVVIKLDEFNLPPALVEKSDGASVYLTRDIMNLKYRLKKYNPAKILYVIGNEQSFQFEQLFAAAKKLGLGSAELVHIKYGLVLGETGKKLSTREGNTVSMRDVLDHAKQLARGVVEKKNPELKPGEMDDIARAVALGAVKYFNLKENRTTDIVFDWDAMLDLTGESAPYLQYTHARLLSILRKAGKGGKISPPSRMDLNTDEELALARKIFEYPSVIRAAGKSYSTSIVAVYLYKLAVAANKFYETTPVLKDEDRSRRSSRLALVSVAARTLRSGLELLCVDAPEKI